jgi:carbamoyltransferase
MSAGDSRWVLGLWDGHDAGAALLYDGVVVAAVSEERLTRVKGQGGFPSRSLQAVLQLGGVRADQVDVVAVAGRIGRLPARILDRRYAAMAPESVDQLSPVSQWHAAYQNRLAQLPVARELERLGSRLVLGRRLAEHGFSTARLALVDHHHAHAATAFAAADGESSLILTMDGYGDGISTAIWTAGPSGLHALATDGPRSSVALLYGVVTQLLGFREGEEGKVTGLAALGRVGAPGAVDRRADLRPFLTVENGRIRVRMADAIRCVRDALKGGVTPEQIAWGIQAPMEDAVVELATCYLRETGRRRLAVAGGLFANVSLNGRLAGLDLDYFTVFPAMGDQGLCVGAALIASDLRAARPLPSLRVGCDIGGGVEPDPEEVAGRLAAGAIMGVARGRMEFGPRALGGRSILFDPRRPQLAQRLGAALCREPFMPFAPVLLARHWNDVFASGRTPIRRATREMTLALPVRRCFADLAPVAVAADGTARPQVIDDEDDPWLAAVLAAFHERTGCPALINTSFNRHREPIVCSAAEAEETAKRVGLDACVVGERLLPAVAAGDFRAASQRRARA